MCNSGNSPMQNINGKKELPWKIPHLMYISGMVMDPVAWWRVSLLEHSNNPRVGHAVRSVLVVHPCNA
eukprot:2408885-Ditylum_brightwellii.AAC.1